MFNDELSLAATVEFYGHTTVSTVARYRLGWESHTTRPGLGETAEGFRYSSSSWVLFGGRTATPNDSVAEFSAPSGPANFVSALGDVAMRITWQPINDEDPAQDGWLQAVDTVTWLVTN